MTRRAPVHLIHALFCFVLSAGFLVMGFWYPVYLVKLYREDDFRGGGAVMLSLITGLFYGVRAVLALFRAPERGECLQSGRYQSQQ